MRVWRLEAERVWGLEAGGWKLRVLTGVFFVWWVFFGDAFIALVIFARAGNHDMMLAEEESGED